MEVRPLLTITAGTYTLRFSTEDLSFGENSADDELFEGRIISIDDVSQSLAEVYFGASVASTVNARLDNTDNYFSLLLGAVELRGASVQYDIADIENDTILRTFYFTIQGISISLTDATITMGDADADKWETTIPKYRITEDLFDTGTIPDESLGKPVGVWFGNAKNVPLYCIAENTDTDEYDYLIGHGDIDSVSAVYREGNGTKVTVNNTIVASGTNTTQTALKLIDSNATFITSGVKRNMAVINGNSGAGAFVDSVDSETQLTLTKDIFDASHTGETYRVGGEYLVYDGSQSEPYSGYAFIRFALEQKDANDNYLAISADISGIKAAGTSMQNPIWILYLLITDTEWGLGLPAGVLYFYAASLLCDGVKWNAAGGFWEFKKAKEWRDMLLLHAKMASLGKLTNGNYTVSIPAYAEGSETYNKHNMQVMSYSARQVDEYANEVVLHYKYDITENTYLLEQVQTSDVTFGQTRDYYLPLMENNDGAAALSKLLINRFFYQDKVLEFKTGPDSASLAVQDAIIVDYPDLQIFNENYEIIDISIGANEVTIKAAPCPSAMFEF